MPDEFKTWLESEIEMCKLSSRATYENDEFYLKAAVREEVYTDVLERYVESKAKVDTSTLTSL